MGVLSTRLASRAGINADVLDLTFAMQTPPRCDFQAGQFVTLSVGRDPAGLHLRRSYSIASPSDRGEALRFLVRIIPGGSASAFFVETPIGAPVEMTGPHGFFVLAPRHEGDVVFAATGTGIAPVLPMLGELTRRDEPGRRHVFWGLRREEDLFLEEEVRATCAAAGATLEIWLSRPSPGWTGSRGRITDPVLALAPGLRLPLFYLVGNGAMISDVKRRLVAAGIDRRKQIRTEAFFD